MSIIAISLIVFAITLIITKSNVLACKREFVEKRYKAAQVANGHPSFLQKWHWKMWTCPMCSGFWISIVVSFFYSALEWSILGYIAQVLIVFGLNWLWHCLENVLFYTGEIISKILEELFDSQKR